MRVFPDTRLSSFPGFLITIFTIGQKLDREGLEATFHTVEAYPCGCTIDISEGKVVYQPCGIHELPS